jgi:hypothetical protein
MYYFFLFFLANVFFFFYSFISLFLRTITGTFVVTFLSLRLIFFFNRNFFTKTKGGMKASTMYSSFNSKTKKKKEGHIKNANFSKSRTFNFFVSLSK